MREVLLIRDNRLFEIIYILLNKGTTTARELAERFEVSERTIYRDIDVLSGAGIPIYTIQGKGGGITLMSDYVLDKTVLTEKEQDEIIFALQSLNKVQNFDSDKVLSKLSNLFKKEPANWLEVDLTPWGGQEETSEFLVLKEAILNRHIVEFQYINNSSERTIRRVEPQKLLFKERNWYLQGYCLTKNGSRIFRLSRMLQIIDTNQLFEPRELVKINETTSNWNTEGNIDLVLKILPHGAFRVYDEFRQKDITRNKDGSFTVKTSMPGGEWLINYFLSYGIDLEVISPSELRNTLKRRIGELVKKYVE